MMYQKKAADLHRQPFVRPNPNPERSKHPFLRRLYTLLDGYVHDATSNVDWLAAQLGISAIAGRPFRDPHRRDRGVPFRLAFRHGIQKTIRTNAHRVCEYPGMANKRMIMSQYRTRVGNQRLSFDLPNRAILCQS